MTADVHDSGFTVANTANPSIPILLSVPHAGRDYPKSIFDNLRLTPDALVRLEDRYVDRLSRTAISRGMPVIVASRARAWIDLNRDEQDIDAEMVEGVDSKDLPVPSVKQRGGLGLIPRRLSGAGDIWKSPLQRRDVEQRISGYHKPYHETICDILARMRDRFGTAILLDLHSMPPVSVPAGTVAPDFVVGDLFGRSASGHFSEIVQAHFRERGFAVNLNHPYSGDYILRRHARPHAGIHAIQLEVDRAIYLDDLLREPSAAADQIAELVADLVRSLAENIPDSGSLLAAE